MLNDRQEKKWDSDRGHPLVNLVYLGGGLMAAMMTMHPVVLCVSLVISTAYARLLIGPVIWKRFFVMMLPVLFFTAVILPLFSHRGVTPLFYLNGQAVTLESVLFGVLMMLMLMSMFQWFQIANVLLDSEKLLYLFGSMLPTMGLLLSMVFRMLPLMGEWFVRIRDAQRGMGRAARDRSFLGKVKLLGKELSILLSVSLEAFAQMSVSMESRGYGTGRRSSFSLFRFHKRDWVQLVYLLFFYGICLGQIFLGRYQASYFPACRLAKMDMSGGIGLVCLVLAAGLPMITPLAARLVCVFSKKIRQG